MGLKVPEAPLPPTLIKAMALLLMEDLEVTHPLMAGIPIMLIDM